MSRAWDEFVSPRRIVYMPFYSFYSFYHLSVLHEEVTIWVFPDLDQDFHRSDQSADQYLNSPQEPAPFQSPFQDWDVFSYTERLQLFSIMGALSETYLKTNRVPNFYSIDTNSPNPQHKPNPQAKL